MYQVWYKDRDKNSKSGWKPWREAGGVGVLGRLDFHGAIKVLADEMSACGYDPDRYMVRVTYECATERGGHAILRDRGPNKPDCLDDCVEESARERSYERERYDD